MIEAMKAETFHLRFLPNNFIIQPKLDGIRAIWDGRVLWTKNKKEIVGVPHITESLQANFSNISLDGELYSHNKDLDFNTLAGNIKRTKNIQKNEKIQFFVFDYPVENITFLERFNKLKTLITDQKNIKLIETKILSEDIINEIKSIDCDLYDSDGQVRQCLENTLNVFEEDGYEGSILRNLDGFYEFGKRSKNVLKVKKWYDAEFLVIDIIPLKNYEKIISDVKLPGYKKYANGTWYKNGKETILDEIGAIVCETLDKNGNITVFEVGSGFNSDLRKYYFKNQQEILSKQVTVKYQELTPRGVPRFPVFKSVRDYE